MSRCLPSKSRLQLPADSDIQAACPSKRVATRRESGLQTRADADHAVDGDGKDCNREDEAPETVDKGELVGQQKWDHRQSKRQKIANSGSSSSRKCTTWEDSFNVLVQYNDDNQHTRVPRIYVDPSTGTKLGNWVHEQRQLYSRDQLSDEPIHRLDSIGFRWKAREESDSAAWDTWFELLVTFKEEHEHTRVPKVYVDAFTGSKLGNWVHVQRRSYAREKLSDERRQRLESIGFEWKPREQSDSQSWDSWFQLLVEYKEDHEHTRVPQRYVDASTGSKLGRWIVEQRQRHSKNQLSDERRQRLDSIGFEWKVREQSDSQSWDSWFQLLVEYKEEHEHTRVPFNYVVASNGSKLGHWVQHQRQQYSGEHLPDERRQHLESIGFEWKPRKSGASESWDAWFQLLVTFKKEHDHTRVPINYVDASTGSKLGRWVNRQRQKYSGEQLSDERIHRLESIGFEWKPREQNESETWNSWFQLLVEYMEDNQHTRVPPKYVDASTGSKLGNWVKTQRRFYAREKLSDERRQQLESIGFEWSPSQRGVLK